MRYPTGRVTFLFTDMEGSTSLAQTYPNTRERLREHHNDIFRHAIAGALTLSGLQDQMEIVEVSWIAKG